MSAFFRSGAKAVPVGAASVAVTGLALPFPPGSVVVSLRQPEGDADIIAAHVVGAPTQDGFSAVLSAPVAAEGYVLDWTVLGEEISLVSDDTLAVSHASLASAVARYLGYDPAALTDEQTAEVDGFVQTGVRNFYSPPALDGVDAAYEWSFLKIQGSVETEPGVTVYPLPDGFGRIAGQLRFPAEAHRPSVPVVPFADLPRWRGPRIAAAVVWRNALGGKGQLRELHLSSSPDAPSLLSFLCEADTGPLSADIRPYPLGGALFSECIVESCLAAAEQRANDEAGIHTQNFNRLLVSSISRDRKNGAQEFGPMCAPADALHGY